MTYTPHTPADIEAMMAEVGVSSWKELFASIPENLLLNRPLQLPEALSEYDLINYFKSLADRNCVFSGEAFWERAPIATLFLLLSIILFRALSF